MGKLPAFFFYPRDWLTDANLRRCSSNARGVWIDMLCIMWECENRGVLSTDGEPWTDDEIASSVPGENYKNILALQELLRNKVAKRSPTGAIFSKRMVEDEGLRQKWRKDKQRRKANFHHDFHQDVHLNVSQLSDPSSVSSSTSKIKPPLPPFSKGGTNRSRWAKPAQVGHFDAERLTPEYQDQIRKDIEEILKQHPELA